MPSRPTVLAVYGTLRRGQRNHEVIAGAAFLGNGLVRGSLYEMPRSALRAYAYPALVLDGGGPIVVELYRIADLALLSAVDELEAFDPNDLPGSQYVRREVPIEDGPVDAASVYAYNGPPGEMGGRILDGDWTAYLAAF